MTAHRRARVTARVNAPFLWTPAPATLPRVLRPGKTTVAVPKRKTSKQRRDTRRATHAIDATRMGRCPRCSSPVRTHHVCGVCGYYRGRPVVEIEG
jgi:large subunit ribosomal protein L32